ncbi:MAG: PEP-CTERM sorting domain-containing protein [Candidatus Krumholzibacteriaceae bacterium]|jgi:hypothetical protein
MKRLTLLAVAAIFIMTMVGSASAVPRLQTYIVGSSYYEKVDLNAVGGWNPTAGGHVDVGTIGATCWFGGGGQNNWWEEESCGNHHRGHHDGPGPGCAAPEPGTLSLLGLGLLGMIPILKRKKD